MKPLPNDFLLRLHIKVTSRPPQPELTLAPSSRRSTRTRRTPRSSWTPRTPPPPAVKPPYHMMGSGSEHWVPESSLGPAKQSFTCPLCAAAEPLDLPSLKLHLITYHSVLPPFPCFLFPSKRAGVRWGMRMRT